jgi:hypothetical protein
MDSAPLSPAPSPPLAHAACHADTVITAKHRITQWIDDLRVAGSEIGPGARQELLAQLALARPVRMRDGALELVLPALSSLGVGIFQRSFRVEATTVRIVPYGAA